MRKKDILILGAGLSGLSAAYFLKKKKIRTKIFEKEANPGGLCRSIKKKGFVFDLSGHLLHFRDKSALSLVRKILKGNLARHKRDSYVYAFNKFIPYPFQVNFNYLPKSIAKECLSGFISSRKQNSVKSDNFLQWIHNKFGKGIADLFMIPYNTKLWKTPLDELDYKWAERFVIIPTVRQVKENLKKNRNNHLGYNDYFWYPEKGGIEELIKGLSSMAGGICTNSQAVKINLKEKTMVLKDGKKQKFDKLISTIPLPELGKIITPLPDDIRRSFKQLKWVSIYNVNLGVKTKTEPPRHWVYFSQKNIPFFRVGFFHNFSSCLAPAGQGALYADISYSKARPIDRRVIGARIRKYLNITGIIRSEDEIRCECVNDIKYGYPVYNRDYSPARKKILNFLSENSIIPCGRYGSWRYLSMEDVILEAEKICHDYQRSNS